MVRRIRFSLFVEGDGGRGAISWDVTPRVRNHSQQLHLRQQIIDFWRLMMWSSQEYQHNHTKEGKYGHFSFAEKAHDVTANLYLPFQLLWPRRPSAPAPCHSFPEPCQSCRSWSLYPDLEACWSRDETKGLSKPPATSESPPSAAPSSQKIQKRDDHRTVCMRE